MTGMLARQLTGTADAMMGEGESKLAFKALALTFRVARPARNVRCIHASHHIHAAMSASTPKSFLEPMTPLSFTGPEPVYDIRVAGRVWP
jgi:hypothetical protein